MSTDATKRKNEGNGWPLVAQRMYVAVTSGKRSWLIVRSLSWSVPSIIYWRPLSALSVASFRRPEDRDKFASAVNCWCIFHVILSPTEPDHLLLLIYQCEETSFVYRRYLLRVTFCSYLFNLPAFDFSLSLPAQDLPFPQIFPTIDSLPSSGVLTPRLYDWTVSSEHLGFYFQFLH